MVLRIYDVIRVSLSTKIMIRVYQNEFSWSWSRECCMALVGVTCNSS